MTLTITGGPWGLEQVEAFLRETVIPIRLASLRTDADGRSWPVVQSLWFTYQDQSLWCATQEQAALVGRLRREAAVGFEVSGDEPPYRGVRGTGLAEVIPDGHEVLGELITRYGQQGTRLQSWLLARAATEVALRIDSLQVSSWDYAARMRG